MLRLPIARLLINTSYFFLLLICTSKNVNVFFLNYGHLKVGLDVILADAASVWKCLIHKWLGICYNCHNYNPVLSSLMTCHRMCNKSTTTAPHVEQELTMISPLVFNGVCVSRALVFCVIVCRSLFVVLSFFLLPLWLDLRFLITLISSKFSNYHQSFIPFFQFWQRICFPIIKSWYKASPLKLMQNNTNDVKIGFNCLSFKLFWITWSYPWISFCPLFSYSITFRI